MSIQFGRKDKFNPENNVQYIEFGSQAKLLDTELKELQKNVNYKMGFLASKLKGLHFKGEGIPYSITGDVITFKEGAVFLCGNGKLFNLSRTKVKFLEGESFLTISNVEDKIVKSGDIIHKYGNATLGETMKVDFIDEELGEETSRRVYSSFEVLVSEERNPDTSIIKIVKTGDDVKVENIFPSKSNSEVIEELDELINKFIEMETTIQTELTTLEEKLTKEIDDKLTAHKNETAPHKIGNFSVEYDEKSDGLMFKYGVD